MQEHEVADGQHKYAFGNDCCIPLLLACHATPQVSGWLHVDIQLVDTVLTLLSSVQREQQTTLSTACCNVSGFAGAQVTDCWAPLNVISERLHCATIM